MMPLGTEYAICCRTPYLKLIQILWSKHVVATPKPTTTQLLRHNWTHLKLKPFWNVCAGPTAQQCSILAFAGPAVNALTGHRKLLYLRHRELSNRLSVQLHTHRRSSSPDISIGLQSPQNSISDPFQWLKLYQQIERLMIQPCNGYNVSDWTS